jgi:hypothetical protein
MLTIRLMSCTDSLRDLRGQANERISGETWRGCRVQFRGAGEYAPEFGPVGGRGQGVSLGVTAGELGKARFQKVSVGAGFLRVA